jgi:hypothetical protein
MAAPTQADIQALQDQINDLNTRLDEMSKNMDKIEKSSSTLSKNIGDTKNLLGDAYASIVNIRKEFTAFATDTQAQYKYAEILAKESKSTAVTIGLSVGRSKEFTKSFNRAAAEVQKFGGDASDAGDIIEEMVEKSGRVRIASPEEVGNIYKISKAVGLQADSTAEMAERMDLMGVSSENFYKNINQMTIDSQKLGLNSTKVAQQLNNNFQKMSNMSFSNGVKGMTEMAKLAVKMRMDVGDMLNMSKKFYNPEGAIEAAAELQLLGGDIAEAFGDPFETMYLARNKPEELAKKVQKMTENMVQFNEKTGEYELPAEAIQQFEALDKQLNLGVDNIIDMARQASKIKDIKMNVSGNITDEETREGLASMAKMKDGKWVVDFQGKEIGIEDIGADLAEQILAAPKDEEDAIMEIAYNSMTTNEILANILEAMKTGFVAESNVYELTEEILRPGMTELFKGVEKQVESAVDALQGTEYGKMRERMLEQAEMLGIATGEGVAKVFAADFIGELKSEMEKVNWSDIFDSDIDKILNRDKGPGQEIDKGPGEDDFLLRSSGQVTSFSSEDDIIGAKKGGPLDKLMDKGLPSSSSMNSKIEFGNLDISGRIEIVSPDGSTKDIDMTDITPKIENIIISKITKMFNNGGLPDGSSVPQGSKGFIQTMR